MLKHRMALEEVTATHEQLRAAMPDVAQIEAISRTFHSLSDPTRCKLLIVLSRHEVCVSDLAAIVEASISSVSHHLRELRETRLVKLRREGNSIYYSVDDAHVGNLFKEALYHLEHIEQDLPDHPAEAGLETAGNRPGAKP